MKARCPNPFEESNRFAFGTILLCAAVIYGAIVTAAAIEVGRGVPPGTAGVSISNLKATRAPGARLVQGIEDAATAGAGDRAIGSRPVDSVGQWRRTADRAGPRRTLPERRARQFNREPK